MIHQGFAILQPGRINALRHLSLDPWFTKDSTVPTGTRVESLKKNMKQWNSPNIKIHQDTVFICIRLGPLNAAIPKSGYRWLSMFTSRRWSAPNIWQFFMFIMNYHVLETWIGLPCRNSRTTGTWLAWQRFSDKFDFKVWYIDTIWYISLNQIGYLRPNMAIGNPLCAT